MNYITPRAPIAANFGHGAVMLQARGSEPLTLEQIAQHAPAVFATHAHESRSARYAFISTADMLQGLAKYGFHPWSVQQAGFRDQSLRGFTKHMIRFRSSTGLQQLTKVDDSIFEICLLGSHDGSCQEQLFAGFLRLACLNGMVVGDGAVASLKIRHSGHAVEHMAQAMQQITDQSHSAVARVEQFRAIELSRGDQLAFARASLELRFDEGKAPVEPARLLEARRSADNGNDLWRTFNRVQENLTRGGISFTSRGKRNGQEIVTHRHTRPVQSVDGDLKLNRALWVLADEMAKAKSAA